MDSTWLLFSFGFIGFLSFFVTSIKLLSIYRSIGDDNLVLTFTSFLLLSISQLCSATSSIYQEPRTSTTLYVATSSLAIAAFAVMLFHKGFEETILYEMMPLMVYPIAIDAVAGILSTSIAIRAKKATRILMLMLSISFYIRAIIPAIAVERIALLTLSEAIRSFAATALAINTLAKIR